MDILSLTAGLWINLVALGLRLTEVDKPCPICCLSPHVAQKSAQLQAENEDEDKNENEDEDEDAPDCIEPASCQRGNDDRQHASKVAPNVWIMNGRIDVSVQLPLPRISATANRQLTGGPWPRGSVSGRTLYTSK